MSASPNKAGWEIHTAETESVAGRSTAPSGFTGHEALQALLAFSSLHEQIRQRRLREKLNGGRLPTADDWQLEQFVLDEVLQLVAERALAISGADGIAIALAESDAIVCRASAGSIAPDAGRRLDPNSGFSGECLISGRIVRCDDTETDPRVDLQACRRLGVRSMVGIPLSAKHNVVGLVEAFSSEPYGFNDSDVRSLNLLAELILSAMRPEEEDRLAEISQRVIHPEVIELEVEVAPAAEVVSTPEPAPELAPEPAAESAPFESPIVSEPEVSKSTPDQVLLPEPENKPFTEPITVPMEEHATLDRSRPGLTLVAALVLLAALLGVGVWWTLGHQARSASSNPHATASAPQKRGAQDSRTVAPPEAPLPAALLDTDNDAPPPRTPAEAGLLPQVMGIRHWSSEDSSTVVIDLQDQVQYEAHRLPNPQRIYFDIYDTKLVPQLTNRIIPVDDALVARVRVAQPMASVTRVVLETKGTPDFSVSLEPNPYRLVIEVRKVGSKTTARAKVDLFAPANSSVPSATVPSAPAVSAKQDKAPVATAKPIETAQNPAVAHGDKLRVVLDAGHGGWDLGTVGRKGLLEKDLVLDIVERAGQLIADRLGAEVIYTRKDDNYLPLEKRAEIANVAGAQLFVSVHANYSDYPSARGVETYYSNSYSSVKARTEEADETSALRNIDWTKIDIREKVHESRRIAASVQRALYVMLAAKNPGLPNRGVKEAHYVVLTGTSMPAVLAEVSFVSSPTDENNLQSSTYRQQIAEALYNGIARYEASNRPVKLASAATKPSGR